MTTLETKQLLMRSKEEGELDEEGGNEGVQEVEAPSYEDNDEGASEY